MKKIFINELIQLHGFTYRPDKIYRVEDALGDELLSKARVDDDGNKIYMASEVA